MSHHRPEDAAARSVAANPWSWSASGIVCPELALTPVLQYRAAPHGDTGWVKPRFRTLRLQLWRDAAQTIPHSVPDSFVRLRWTTGRATFTADLDVTAGSCTATVPCDSLDVGVFVGKLDGAPASASCAVVRSIAADVSRVARRTWTGTIGNGTVIPVPAGAQQLQITVLSNVAGPYVFRWLDSVPAIISEFVGATIANGAPFFQADCPAGAASLVVVSVPAGPQPGQVTFRIPL